jgi:UDP:flavonoid glycosyltransferase YjiC (YdhE family)
VVAQEAKAVHITILTVGSRGDVQPYLALAAGLRQAGYQVRVAPTDPSKPQSTSVAWSSGPLPATHASCWRATPG